MSWFKKLFSQVERVHPNLKNSNPVIGVTAYHRKSQSQPQENPRLTAHVVCGEMDVPLYFVDEERNIHKTIVEVDHTIQNFPGIVEEDFWTREKYYPGH